MVEVVASVADTVTAVVSWYGMVHIVGLMDQNRAVYPHDLGHVQMLKMRHFDAVHSSELLPPGSKEL